MRRPRCGQPPTCAALRVHGGERGWRRRSRPAPAVPPRRTHLTCKLGSELGRGAKHRPKLDQGADAQRAPGGNSGLEVRKRPKGEVTGTSPPSRRQPVIPLTPVPEGNVGVSSPPSSASPKCLVPNRLGTPLRGRLPGSVAPRPGPLGLHGRTGARDVVHHPSAAPRRPEQRGPRADPPPRTQPVTHTGSAPTLYWDGGGRAAGHRGLTRQGRPGHRINTSNVGAARSPCAGRRPGPSGGRGGGGAVRARGGGAGAEVRWGRGRFLARQEEADGGRFLSRWEEERFSPRGRGRGGGAAVTSAETDAGREGAQGAQTGRCFCAVAPPRSLFRGGGGARPERPSA